MNPHLIVFHTAFLGESLALPWKWKDRLSPRNMKVINILNTIQQYFLLAQADIEYTFQNSWLTFTIRLHWEDLQHCIDYLLEGGRVYIQKAAQQISSENQTFVLSSESDVLKYQIVNQMPFNIYAWSHFCDLHTHIITIKWVWKFLIYPIVLYDNCIAEDLTFEGAHTIVQSWLEVLLNGWFERTE